MKIFSKRLLKLMKEKQLSAYKLAKIVVLSNQCAINWLNEINEPKISYLIKIADYFNVSTDYLLGRTEY